MRRARRFNCQPESVPGARHFVRDVLSAQAREIVEAAELMASELATNCVRHARSDFELAIHLSRDEIRVEVSDHGRGQPVLRSPTPQEQSGRGLRIVQELSDAWGTTPSPNGKLVWFTLQLREHAGEHKSRSSASSDEVSSDAMSTSNAISPSNPVGLSNAMGTSKVMRQTWAPTFFDGLGAGARSGQLRTTAERRRGLAR